MPAETLDPHDVRSAAFVNDQGRLRRLRWQSPYQPLGPNWIAAFELDLDGPADNEFDWSKAPIYQPDPDNDTTLAPELLEECNRLIEMIERLGPPEHDP